MTASASGPAWPVPELIGAGVPVWLSYLIPIGGLLAAVVIAAFLAYCIHAGTRALPRHEAALEVMERLDPSLLAAFGVTDVYRRRYIDVKRLAALKPLLDNEDTVRRDDERLEAARQRVADARAVETAKPRKKARE
ncbi:hypothetical protein MTE01_28620 [Microbacterium testaceum]|uniref:Uncharacterized protein n=1 Tax=Microbacterium testaceum TaxID=2033 RepID=A0A4Y3QQA7_MICTE|nr:hypothetical protein [Microbacterium testaceum]GEB46917.1 hypothetical protein MTE01_28620 [Microbacterium testaceum]